MRDELFCYVDYKIAETQGELYQHIYSCWYSMEEFSDAFMSSTFCSEYFDKEYSHYHYAIPIEILEMSGINLNDIQKTDIDVSVDCAYWIGYTYRLMHRATGISSRNLLERFPFGLMVAMYPGYHTIDEEQQMERLFDTATLERRADEKKQFFSDSMLISN